MSCRYTPIANAFNRLIRMSQASKQHNQQDQLHDELKAEAEKIADEMGRQAESFIMFQLNSPTPESIFPRKRFAAILLAFAQRHGAQERLRGRIEEAESAAVAIGHLKTLLGFLEDGTLVRSTAHDSAPGSAMRQLPLVKVLRDAQIVVEGWIGRTAELRAELEALGKGQDVAG